MSVSAKSEPPQAKGAPLLHLPPVSPKVKPTEVTDLSGLGLETGLLEKARRKTALPPLLNDGPLARQRAKSLDFAEKRDSRLSIPELDQFDQEYNDTLPLKQTGGAPSLKGPNNTFVAPMGEPDDQGSVERSEPRLPQESLDRETRVVEVQGTGKKIAPKFDKDALTSRGESLKTYNVGNYDTRRQFSGEELQNEGLTPGNKIAVALKPEDSQKKNDPTKQAVSPNVRTLGLGKPTAKPLQASPISRILNALSSPQRIETAAQSVKITAITIKEAASRGDLARKVLGVKSLAKGVEPRGR
jgi:hypothetical protein